MYGIVVQLTVKVKCSLKLLLSSFKCVFSVYYNLQEGLIQRPFVGSDMILNVKDLFTRIVIHGLFKNLKFKILSRLVNLDYNAL